MEPTILKFERKETMRMLNLGCGRQIHSDWINMDLEATSPGVIEHDVTRGVPFEDETLDVVYHSHILEHLQPTHGEKLIHECFRVLKPGGILRVVVPDLERIARLYLRTHQEAWMGEKGADTNYRWMKLELLDQLVRESSGGRMGQYMASQEIKNSNFVQSRVGDEFWMCRTPSRGEVDKPRLLERLKKTSRRLREALAKQLVKILLGKKAKTAFNEGLFRSSGEIHRWMYDRFSLKELCSQIGFVNFRVCEANESGIEKFERFKLDSKNGQIRKPDSLFIECEKPRPGVSLRRAA